MYAEFADRLDLETNEALQALAASLRAQAPPWVRDVVPALCGIAVHLDPYHPGLPAAPLEAFGALLEGAFRAAGKFDDRGHVVEVPVCYEPPFGLDLKDIAEKTGLPAEEIARRHVRSDHRVLMVGFAPGQPYIGGLDPKLYVPRRATPRTMMPVGAVAIAVGQTAVYPYGTPGGWNVIGRTPLRVFDPAREPASLFAPGDRVKFLPITRAEYERLAGGAEP